MKAQYARGRAHSRYGEQSGAQYADVQFWTFGKKTFRCATATCATHRRVVGRLRVRRSSMGRGDLRQDRFDDASSMQRRGATRSRSRHESNRPHSRRAATEKSSRITTPMTKDPRASACRRVEHAADAERAGTCEERHQRLRVSDDLHDQQRVFTRRPAARSLRCCVKPVPAAASRRWAATKTCRRVADRATSSLSRRRLRSCRARGLLASCRSTAARPVARDAPVAVGRSRFDPRRSVLNLQMHESIGHALELDRALGWEANFSGVSWATPDQVGKLRYGSDLLNIYADNALPLAWQRSVRR